MTILLLASAWLLVSALVVALCAAAQRGEVTLAADAAGPAAGPAAIADPAA